MICHLYEVCLGGNITEAEFILLQNRLFLRAIGVNKLVGFSEVIASNNPLRSL
jgi:hypothetical protein